jgi:Spy/CpxP family protein refolding chaperone
LVGLLVIGGVVALAMAATSCHRGHRHFKDPAKIQKMVQWKVDDVLDDLDATDAQRREIEAAAASIVTDALKLRENRDARHAQVLAELRKAEPDAKALHALLDQRVEAMRAFAHRSVDTALEAYAMLDENQRIALLDEIEEHLEHHR